MGRVTVSRPVLTLSAAGERRRPDALAGEEPLELRVDGQPLAVTMRTPGQDVELAHGFLLGEGVIGSRADVRSARFCDSRDEAGRRTYNVLDIELAPHVPPPTPDVRRTVYTTSSCGVCGKASLDAVRLTTRFCPAADPLTLTPQTLFRLPDALRAAQRVFAATGGVHAAGLFTGDGELLHVREDVGRHNAVDKVLGRALLDDDIPGAGRVLMVSGRASFELVQKAVMAGVPALAAVSAPSSLAVDLARESGLTLVGFLRGTSMNVYAGAGRIATANGDSAAPR